MFVCHPYTYSSDGRGSPSATPPNLTRKISLRSPCSWCDFGLAPVSPHSFQTGSPKVNKVFQRQLLQYWVGGHNNFPQSADHTPPLSTHYSFWLMRTEHWWFVCKTYLFLSVLVAQSVVSWLHRFMEFFFHLHCRTLQFSLLNFSKFLLVPVTKLIMVPWSWISIFLVPSENALRVQPFYNPKENSIILVQHWPLVYLFTIRCQWNIKPPIATLLASWSSQHLTQSIVCSSNPYFLRFQIRMLQEMVTKALLKSRYIMANAFRSPT